jgi:hypothetical protein
MDAKPEPLLADVQRMDGGVLISFDDGRNVFYSASLLEDTIPQAKEIFVPDDEEWPGAAPKRGYLLPMPAALKALLPSRGDVRVQLP